MPKSIKEIRSFDKGTLFNISEKDAPLEAAAFSLNINPNAENGILDAIKAHRLVISIDKLNEVTFAYPVQYGLDGGMTSTTGFSNAAYNDTNVIINNIAATNNQSQCSVRVEGAKGRQELLTINQIEPWMEKTMSTLTLPAAYIPTAAFTIESDYIDYLTNTNAITGTVTDVTFDGFTDNEATIEVNETDPAQVDNDEFIVTTPDGTIKTYIFNNTSGTSGTLDGVKPQIFVGSLSTEATIAAQMKLAIEHANGHNGKITIVQSDGQAEGISDLTPTTGESNLSAAWAANAIYDNLEQASTLVSGGGSAGAGTGLIVDVTTDGSGNPTVVVDEKGSGYVLNDTVTFNEPDLSAEMITNGTMEADSNWSNTTSAPAANYRTEEQVYAGTYSRKFRPDAADEGIISDAFTTVINTAYIVSAWVYPTTYTTVTLKLLEGNGSTVRESNKTGLTTGTWNYIEETFTDTSGGAGAKVQIDSGDEDDGNWYVDAVSVKRQNTFTLTVSDISSKLALTDEHGSLAKYFEVGDYLSFIGTGGTYTGSTAYEFLQIKDIDTEIKRIFFKRRCFGTKSFALAASTSYDIYSNKYTIDGKQTRTTKGTCTLFNWSGYAGNHIGGNASYFYKVNGTSEDQKKRVGVFTPASDNVVFSNANKTMTIDITGGDFPFTEQDTFTIWGSSNSVINSGKSFKALKIDGNTVHLDKAPTDGTISSGALYIESNLLKNHVFHHTIQTADETSSILGSTKQNKINSWTHYAYQHNTLEGSQTISNTYQAQTSDSSQYNAAVAHDINGGGYWEDTTAGHVDEAANYYPCVANDRYITIESEYHGNRISIQNTTSISVSETHIICSENIDTQFSANDVILVGAEYMKVTAVDGVNLFVERAIMGATSTGEANEVAVHNNGATISKCLNMSIRQDVSNTRLEKKQGYNITFFAKQESGTAAGALSLKLGPGYFDKDGLWIANSNNSDLGISNRMVQQEDRWIEFSELDKPDGDEADGDEGIDSTWRKFSIIFYIPEDVEFTTSNADLIVEFASRGLDGSKIGIDLVDLREHQVALIKKEQMVTASSSGFINNSGIKDLIVYDKLDEEITVIPGFKLNQSKLLRPISAFDKSSYASQRTRSKTGEVSYTPKNRETHIGFGSGAEDSPPQWLGYVNSQVFGNDTTDKLYQDEDTVHSYDAGSTTSLSKVAVAGEHEYIKAYWNNTGGIIDASAIVPANTLGSTDLADNSLRIQHTAHSMNIGDNIVLREWQDVPNEWDGRGVWVVTTIQDDYFDCMRYNTTGASAGKDLDPTEIGIAATDTNGMDTANGVLTVDCASNHGLRNGDYVIIYGTANFNTGATFGTSIGPVTVTDSNTFTVLHSGTQDDEEGTIVKEFRLCYRPYYYYGIKEGDSAIYRISPDTRIADASGLDTSGDYIRGTVERSLETKNKLGSIATCYNKKSDGTGGGMIYVLSSEASDYKDTKITTIDVQVAYNKWTETDLDEVTTFIPRFKSFKWSNDSTNGNINTGAPESNTANTGTIAVFGSIAASSSPSIKASGIPSDILETKGPNHTYDSQATSNTTNNPSMFDTRLWLQFRPGGNESFSEGDRFLFAGRTQKYHFNGGDRYLYFADRTPPTTTVFGKEVRYRAGNHKFRCGPGVHPTKGDPDNKHKRLSDGVLRYYAYYCHWLGGHGESRDYLKKISFVKNGKKGANSTSNISADNGKHPYFHFGYNVGWDGNGGRFPNIKVPKYGLAPMLDNDHDGIIDGTGLVVPSKKTLPDQVENIRRGPYGNYHQRVCAHAVALMAVSYTPWVRHWGKLHNFTDNSHFVSGEDRNDKWPYHQDAPENAKFGQLLFISSDVHYGDFQPRRKYNVTTFSSYNNSSIGGYHSMVEVTCSNYGGKNIGNVMQAGDMVYFKANGYNKACYIVKVTHKTKVLLSLKYDGGKSGICTIYPFTRQLFSYSRLGVSNTYSGIADTRESFHWSFDDNNNKSGTRFTKKKRAAGHFVKNWWTAPTSFGFHEGSPSSSEMCNPGVLNRIDKLNFRAGCLIRPFDDNGSTFIGLKAADGTVMSIATAPDSVYHEKNGSYLHYNVGTTTKSLSKNIKFNSKLHIADDTTGTKYTRMFLADTSFLFPDKKHTSEYQMTTSKTKSNSFNNTKPYRQLFSGKIHGYYNTSSGWRPNAANCPKIQIINSEISYGKYPSKGSQYRKGGLWVGACLSIRDQETGIIQTRQIVASASSSTYTYLDVHYPFAHNPANDDTFWVWKHAYVCTAPLRLYRDKNLGYSLGRAYQEDSSHSAFDPYHFITSSSGTGTYANIITSNNTNFSVGDRVEIKDTDSFNGIYTIKAKTHPRVVVIAHSATSNETGIITRHKSDSRNANHNHLLVEIDKPLIHTMFGGLDLRKSFKYTVSSANLDSGDITKDGFGGQETNTLTTSINHTLKAGDMIQLDGSADPEGFQDYDGPFEIEAVTANTFKVINGNGEGTASSVCDGPADNVWWQTFMASQTGASKMGELNHGYYSWSTGREGGNIFRSDRYSADDEDIYMSTGQTVIDIQASSGSNTAGYFKANNIYRYKVSLIYDGYQEGLLSGSTWEYTDTKGRDSLKITLQIKEFSNRLTHICIYRTDSLNNLYKLVKEVKTDDGWDYDDEKYSYEFEDEGNLRATYESRSELSEVLDSIKVKYGMSEEIDGYLFVGNCGHEKIENAENLVFRSKPGKFSVFDYANDFIQLKSKPTALANFLGRLFVFDNTNIYKVNPQSLVIEDTYEGIGCLGKDSVIVTENGMFFADRNGAYLHNGTIPAKISDSIFQSGGTDTAFGGTDNIKDISWSNTGGNALARHPYVIYDSVLECALFFVEYLDKSVATSGEVTHLTSNYIWSFHIKKQRWDLWELDNDSDLGVPFSGDKGEILVPIDNGIYEVRGSGKKMDYTWMSKKIQMQFDSVIKVYNKIKINGIEDNINLDGTKKESSDRLLIQTNAGAMATSDVTYSSSDNDHSTYKLSGSNRKGRWMQFKLEDMTEPIDSIGIIYRLRAVK